MKDLAQQIELGRKSHQKDMETMRTLRKKLREELDQTGIAEQFDVLLERTGSIMHLDQLFQQWASDKNKEL